MNKRPCDKNGIPIYAGDVLKTYHFTSGPRNKKYFVYHVAVERDGKLYGVPAASLGKECTGGEFLLTPWALRSTAIAQGVVVYEGDKRYFLFTDRPRLGK